MRDNVKKYIALAVFTFVTIFALGFLLRGSLARYWFLTQDLRRDVETGVNITNRATSDIKDEIETREDIEIVAENLEIPWEVAFLPSGDLLVTERPGRLVRIDKSGAEHEVKGLSGYTHYGEGGLLGMAMHPNFKENKWLYLYFTAKIEGDVFVNKVSRFEFENDTLLNEFQIIGDIPGARYHDGGRIEFGPDGALYITTGDAGNPEEAQNIFSYAGKILRIRDDGWPLPDNPYADLWGGRVPNANAILIFSYGHRNPQGFTWDEQGNLWSTEHGRSGVSSGFDELNLIEPGKNYGWPEIQGDEIKDKMTTAVIHSGADYTWAPGDAEFVPADLLGSEDGGSIFFTGLRGSALYEAKLDGRKARELKAHFAGEFGRLRAVRLGPDGYLYITTSNRDGRGTVMSGDDKIIRVNPKIFR